MRLLDHAGPGQLRSPHGSDLHRPGCLEGFGMKCSRCQQDNPVPDAKFCPRCGAPVKHADGSGPPAPSYAEVTSALSASLEREKATGAILRVISSSPTDLQAVLDAVVESAARLCEAFDSVIFRRDDDRVRVLAHRGPIPPLGPTGEFSMSLDRGNGVGRAILDKQTVHVLDMQVEAAEFPEGTEVARRQGFRTVLVVPLMRQGVAIGTVSCRRAKARLFTERQVNLLQTFADQAVIAIENVRLFTELQEKNQALTAAHAQVTEALDQQTATSEILGVISRSPTNAQPVFDTIVESAVRLCGAVRGSVYTFDGELIYLGAHDSSPETTAFFKTQVFPRRPSRDLPAERVILDCAVAHIPDFQADPELGATVRAWGLATSVGSILAVPMVRDGHAAGAIAVVRRERGRFSDTQIDLLQTFADQAVIAIENVRLFTELQARNRDLTATGEILRVISSSPTDVQPVFDAIVESAARLCDGVFSALFSFDGELMHLEAGHNWTPEAFDLARGVLPAPPTRTLPAGRAILDRTVVHVPDIEGDREVKFQELSRALGRRSVLVVPMLRDGLPLGAIGVGRAEPGPFSDTQIALLKTFADQAVIAIENVRLFKELEARNHDLTQSLEQQMATGEILGVISSSPTDVQPVFDAIVRSASQLCGGEYAIVTRYDGQLIHLAAQYNARPGSRSATEQLFPRPPS